MSKAQPFGYECIECFDDPSLRDSPIGNPVGEGPEAALTESGLGSREFNKLAGRRMP